jgi:nitronate monooxygenase
MNSISTALAEPAAISVAIRTLVSFGTIRKARIARHNASLRRSNERGETVVQQLLGIDLPIIQAPMAGSQGAALALAVTSTGALGSLPCAMLTPRRIREELSAIRAQTSRPVNVNFFCHTPPVPDAAREAQWRTALAPYYEELSVDAATIPPGASREPFGEEAAAVLRELRPAVVSFHFGLPAPDLLSSVRSFGAKILASATTVAEARWLVAHGVDAVIAQGYEAGGHRGLFLTGDVSTQVGTFALIRLLVRAIDVPVIAAGGIADREGVRAALALGAAAVQVGTAYLLCPEATTAPMHRAALRNAATRETAVTNLFTGRPARGLVNRLMRELGPISSEVPEFPLASAALAPLRAKAEADGRDDFTQLWCGQNPVCRNLPAAEITRELAR